MEDESYHNFLRRREEDEALREQENSDLWEEQESDGDMESLFCWLDEGYDSSAAQEDLYLSWKVQLRQMCADDFIYEFCLLQMQPLSPSGRNLVFSWLGTWVITVQDLKDVRLYSCIALKG